MRRAFVGCVLAVLAGVAGSGCGSIKDGWEELPGPPRVLTSFPPVACFVQNVAGDQVGILCLCDTQGPHDYQFNIQKSVLLRRADIFFTNGLGLDDSFTDKMVANCGNPRLRYRKLADSLPLRLRKKGEEHAEGHDDHDHAHHHHGLYDPHVWLGIPQAIGMVERIRDDLKEVDPARAATYTKNAATYIAKLKKLHAQGKKKLARVKAPIVTFHESMGYFADSFGLKIIGAIEPAPGIEPSNQNLLALVKKCAGKPLVLIAVEPQYPQTAAKTLQEALKKQGVGSAPLVEIDPLETCERAELKPDWYERGMQANIDKLARYAQ